MTHLVPTSWLCYWAWLQLHN